MLHPHFLVRNARPVLIAIVGSLSILSACSEDDNPMDAGDDDNNGDGENGSGEGSHASNLAGSWLAAAMVVDGVDIAAEGSLVAIDIANGSTQRDEFEGTWSVAFL